MATGIKVASVAMLNGTIRWVTVSQLAAGLIPDDEPPAATVLRHLTASIPSHERLFEECRQIVNPRGPVMPMLIPHTNKN